MITIISGGKDSLKLIKAFRNLLYDNEISVLANASDSIWIEGNLFCPDLDDVIYLFAGKLNTAQWTGIKSDTYSTQNLLEKISGKISVIPIGDKARAVSIARSDILRAGGNITEATEHLCKYFGIISKILPATDNRYAAYAEINTDTFTIPEFRKIFEDDYNAEFRASVFIDFKKIPKISEKTKEIINESDAVIIGPGRINTTIFPVLACRNLRSMLKNKFVISLIPNLPSDYSPEKYPAYQKILDILESVSNVMIQDIKEEINIPGAVRLNTTLNSGHNTESLAWEIMSIIRSRSDNLI